MGLRRVLGIDTSLRGTGVGVIERAGNHFTAIAHETLRCPASWPHSRCLVRIQEGICDIIASAEPEVVAIEGVFHCRNVRTAMSLGQARGVAISTCSGRGLPVFEYAPRRVKQSVCGFGAASKQQIAKMIMALLCLPEIPRTDEADALALALCHFHSLTGVSALAPEPI